MVFNMSSFKFTSMQYPRNWANNPTYWYIFFWMVNLYFVCPLNRQANLTNEHCTSESVFVACAHIASVNDLLRVQIPHPSSLIPHSSSLSHNFSFNPPFSAVTLMYPSSRVCELISSQGRKAPSALTWSRLTALGSPKMWCTLTIPSLSSRNLTLWFDLKYVKLF